MIHPRIAGSKVDALAFGEVFVNLDSGKPEGSTGKVALYRELVTLADEWSFLAGSAWLVEQTRLYSDRRLLVSDQGIPLMTARSVRAAARGAAFVRRYAKVQPDVGR